MHVSVTGPTPGTPPRPDRPVQGVLLDGPAHPGYRGPLACTAAGITYRQLDYWSRTGLVRPSLTDRPGGGPLYAAGDVLLLAVVRRLLDTGIAVPQVRAAVSALRARDVTALAGLTLVSDGADVHECTDDAEVLEAVGSGRGVFAIAVGRVWREVHAALADVAAAPTVVPAASPTSVSASVSAPEPSSASGGPAGGGTGTGGAAAPPAPDTTAGAGADPVDPGDELAARRRARDDH